MPSNGYLLSKLHEHICSSSNGPHLLVKLNLLAQVAANILPTADVLLRDVISTVRFYLIDESQEVRVAALRVLRYLLPNDLQSFELFHELSIGHFVCCSLETNRITERVAALKLIRKWLCILSRLNCSRPPFGFLCIIVSIAETKKDPLRRHCLETLRDCSLFFPNEVNDCNGFELLCEKLVEPEYMSITPTIAQVLLVLINDPTKSNVRKGHETPFRRFILAQIIKKVVSPLTNNPQFKTPGVLQLTGGVKIGGKTTPQETLSLQQEQRNQWASARNIILNMTKSFTGLIVLISKPNALLSVVNMIGQPTSAEFCRFVINLFLDLIRQSCDINKVNQHRLSTYVRQKPVCEDPSEFGLKNGLKPFGWCSDFSVKKKNQDIRTESFHVERQNGFTFFPVDQMESDGPKRKPREKKIDTKKLCPLHGSALSGFFVGKHKRYGDIPMAARIYRSAVSSKSPCTEEKEDFQDRNYSGNEFRPYFNDKSNVRGLFTQTRLFRRSCRVYTGTTASPTVSDMSSRHYWLNNNSGSMRPCDGLAPRRPQAIKNAQFDKHVLSDGSDESSDFFGVVSHQASCSLCCVWLRIVLRCLLYCHLDERAAAVALDSNVDDKTSSMAAALLILLIYLSSALLPMRLSPSLNKLVPRIFERSLLQTEDASSSLTLARATSLAWILKTFCSSPRKHPKMDTFHHTESKWESSTLHFLLNSSNNNNLHKDDLAKIWQQHVNWAQRTSSEGSCIEEILKAKQQQLAINKYVLKLNHVSRLARHDKISRFVAESVLKSKLSDDWNWEVIIVSLFGTDKTTAPTLRELAAEHPRVLRRLLRFFTPGGDSLSKLSWSNSNRNILSLYVTLLAMLMSCPLGISILDSNSNNYKTLIGTPSNCIAFQSTEYLKKSVKMCIKRFFQYQTMTSRLSSFPNRHPGGGGLNSCRLANSVLTDPQSKHDSDEKHQDKVDCITCACHPTNNSRRWKKYQSDVSFLQQWKLVPYQQATTNDKGLSMSDEIFILTCAMYSSNSWGVSELDKHGLFSTVKSLLRDSVAHHLIHHLIPVLGYSCHLCRKFLDDVAHEGNVVLKLRTVSFLRCLMKKNELLPGRSASLFHGHFGLHSKQSIDRDMTESPRIRSLSCDSLLMSSRNRVVSSMSFDEGDFKRGKDRYTLQGFTTPSSSKWKKPILEMQKYVSVDSEKHIAMPSTLCGDRQQGLFSCVFPWCRERRSINSSSKLLSDDCNINEDIFSNESFLYPSGIDVSFDRHLQDKSNSLYNQEYDVEVEPCWKWVVRLLVELVKSNVLFVQDTALSVLIDICDIESTEYSMHLNSVMYKNDDFDWPGSLRVRCLLADEGFQRQLKNGWLEKELTKWSSPDSIMCHEYVSYLELLLARGFSHEVTTGPMMRLIEPEEGTDKLWLCRLNISAIIETVGKTSEKVEQISVDCNIHRESFGCNSQSGCCSPHSILKCLSKNQLSITVPCIVPILSKAVRVCFVMGDLFMKVSTIKNSPSQLISEPEWHHISLEDLRSDTSIKVNNDDYSLMEITLERGTTWTVVHDKKSGDKYVASIKVPIELISSKKLLFFPS
eukprot:GHVL01006725.1.p1 GENE.GHVL01006725.1~~GHVL01006725.1.p1  ORF type:complete len:1567 (+),score=221.36 GHVL01006725.1:1965-6665(+)